ncbi:MAG: hypothetical protein M1819_006151 [Sarea resinae]|nr:MAG: hypothetical protein M1819_006151 [Sarea resinae]
MPPSNRRTRTRREAELQDLSDAELADSSPSRPASKKRRTNGTDPSSIVANGTASANLQEVMAADDEPESAQEQVDAIIPYLNVAKEPAQVLIDHANTILERDYKDGVQAYAKVAGREWTYYVKTLKVNIGRPPDATMRPNSEGPPQSSPGPASAPAPGPSHDDDRIIHIDLGPSKLVSRLHAEIFFDSDGAAAGWQLFVNGRNGVKVNDTNVKRGQRMTLTCGDVLEIAGTQMMFVTPEDEPQIHPQFLRKAQMLAAEEEGFASLPLPHAHPESSTGPRPSSQHLQYISQNGGLGQIPLAPAPPDFKRQSTPASSRGADTDQKSKPSPAYNRGMMLESTEEIDYSLDSAKDIKPPFSYATMIGQAILASDEEKLTLNNIYQWIMEKYAFYRHSQSGWQNSIRHNLSLNKSFQKIPRRTDEPGKGMKWQIVPEHRDDFTRRGQRSGNRGNRGSSAPSSPAAKENSGIPPSSSQTMQPIGVDDSREAPVSNNRMKFSPRSTTPPLSSYPVAPKEAYTPERGSRLPAIRRGENGVNELDQSPIPGPRSKPYGFSDAAAGSPPTLSSSAYMDDNQSMITPAPRRQLPKLAPPSTAQVPSTYMPTSSPAPFWKYVDMNSTPARPIPDLSPYKSGPGLPQSSSPPPAESDRRDAGSPTKAGSARPMTARPEDKPLKSENGVTGPPQEDEEENLGGFDLARGFQPIGSFHKNMTNGVSGA